MAQFLERHGWAIAVVILGAAVLWFGFSALRQPPTKRSRWMGYLTWGPFALVVGDYLAKRGGLTKREKLAGLSSGP
jgi:hypothetical protein